VASVTPFHVEEAARLWGRSCGATTVRHTLATLAAALQAAMRADLIHKNPARLARKPRAAEQEFDLFTPGELLAVIEACVKDRRLYPIALCAAVGCRIGEALAASAGDIDARAGRLSIDKTVTRKRTVGPPKSRHGKRTVTVPRPARPALSQPPDTRSYRTILSRWELLLPALGIRYRGLHQLRHSVATYAIAAGVPVANVARDLGDSVQTVVKVYLHPVEGQGVGDAMEGLLGGAAAGRKRGAMKAKKGGKPGA
jgi:integrase